MMSSRNKHTATFYQLASLLEKLNKKVSLEDKKSELSGYLRMLDTSDLAIAICFLKEGPFDIHSGHHISLGSRTLALTTSEYCKIDHQQVFNPSHKAVGNVVDTIVLLIQNISDSHSNRSPQYLSLNQISEILLQFSRLRDTKSKKKWLISCWNQMTDVEIKYVLKLLMNKPLLNQHEASLATDALAQISGRTSENVEKYLLLTGSFYKTAENLQRNTQSTPSYHLTHPLPLMQATKVDINSITDHSNFYAEERLPGIRGQLMIDSGKVQLFDRYGNDLSALFPDIVNTTSFTNQDSVLLDGQIIIYKNDEMLSQVILTQKRFGIPLHNKAIQQYPAYFIAFDILYFGGDVMTKSYKDRRNYLEEIHAKYSVPIIKNRPISNSVDINRLNENILLNGGNGLIMKKSDSCYKPGSRSNHWIKIQSDEPLLKAVLMYIQWDIRNKGKLIFTFGVNVASDRRYSDPFIPIGKLDVHQTDSYVKQVLDQLDDLVTEKFGPTLALRPEIVAEVTFSKVGQNKRTKAQFNLIQPEVQKLRRRNSDDRITTLSDVETLYIRKQSQKRAVTNQQLPFYW